MFGANLIVYNFRKRVVAARWLNKLNMIKKNIKNNSYSNIKRIL